MLSEPYVIVCLNVIVSDTDTHAEYLASTMAQVMVSITRGRMPPVHQPPDDLIGLRTPSEYPLPKDRFSGSFIGSEDSVKRQLEDFIKEYGEIDELMAISYNYDQDKQLESYQRLQKVIQS